MISFGDPTRVRNPAYDYDQTGCTADAVSLLCHRIDSFESVDLTWSKAFRSDWDSQHQVAELRLQDYGVL